MDTRRRSCVFGCDIRGIALHGFPHPVRKPDLFVEWCMLTGIQQTNPMHTYVNRRVCSRHFLPEEITSGHRLIQSVQPSLHLQGVHRSCETIIQEEHNYCCLRGNNSLNSLTSEELKRRYICAKHFQPDSIHLCNMRNRLIGTAVPFHFQSVEVTSNNSHIDEETTNVDINSDVLSLREVLKVKTPTKFYRKRKISMTEEKTASTKLSLTSMWQDVNVNMNTPTQRSVERDKKAAATVEETRFDSDSPCDAEPYEEHSTDFVSVSETVELICQICLRTDFERTDMDDALADFYDELVFYDTSVSEPQFCPLCQHLLRKSYNFRQKCRRAHILLRESDAMKRLGSLHSELPASTALGVCTDESNVKIYDCESTDQYEAETENMDDKPEGFLDDPKDSDNDNYNDVTVTPSNPETIEPTNEQEQPECKIDYAQQRIDWIKSKFRDVVLARMDRGELNDIEDQGTVLTKELFLTFLDRTSVKGLRVATDNTDRLRFVLLKMLKTYNPVYNFMFDVDYLNNRDKAVAEFNERKDSQLYLEAAYKCELCYKVFESQANLENHKQWHDPEKPLVCDICPMRFTSKPIRNAHKSKCHFAIYRCKLCHFYSSSHNVMKNHQTQLTKSAFRRCSVPIVKSAIQYVCNVCNKLYESEDMLRTHHTAMHGERQSCTLCASDFASQSGLQTHIQLKHSVSSEELSQTPTEQCEHCAAAFHRKEALKKHVRTRHTLVGIDKTRSCGEVFPSAEKLNSHRSSTKHQKKSQELFRICYICDEILASTSLYQHFKSAHPSESYVHYGTLILCEFCGQSFKIQTHYRDHLNIHKGAKPYECSECGLRFARRLSVKRHLKRHGAGGAKYPCTYCDKVFTTVKARLHHQKVHSRERPHRCDTCGEVFTIAAALKTHIDRAHRNKKCERELPSRKRALRDHNKTSRSR